MSNLSKYDEAKDDFISIETESDALSCIERYPNMIDRWLPDKFKYLLKKKDKIDIGQGNKLKSII